MGTLQQSRLFVASLIVSIGSLAGSFDVRAASVAEVALLSGPERFDRLVEGARQEGGLQLYSLAAIENMSPIIAGFEKKYGLRVRTWKGSASDIRHRALTEFRANRSDVDVIETAGPDMEALHREGLLQRVESPTIASLIPDAVPPHREWMVSRISVITAGYNTNLIAKEDLPARYEDLIDPRWKGKLAVESGNSNIWLMGVAAAKGEQATVNLFRRIASVNGVSLRRGHVAIAGLMASGEVPFALTVYRNNVEQLREAGAPVQTHVIAPLLGLTTGIAVARRTPRPYSAVLFWEYFLTEAQKFLLAQRTVPSNRTVKEPPPDLTFLNSGQLLDDGDKWQKLFQEVFVRSR